MRSLPILVFACLVIGSRVGAQVTPRNLLEKEMDLAGLHGVLVSRAAWRPFPQTPAEWAALLPDSLIKTLIRHGEACLGRPFTDIPASVTLDFFRNGNRTRYENLSFDKRNRLWALVLAESAEGKGRFLDAIVDGIWSISEETFWGASAHLFLQKEGGMGCGATRRTPWSIFSQPRPRPTSPGRIISSARSWIAFRR